MSEHAGRAEGGGIEGDFIDPAIEPDGPGVGRSTGVVGSEKHVGVCREALGICLAAAFRAIDVEPDEPTGAGVDDVVPFIKRGIEGWEGTIVPAADGAGSGIVQENAEIVGVLVIEDVAAGCHRRAGPCFH